MLTVSQKFQIGVLAVLVWMLALLAHHFFPDIEVSGLTALAASTLTGLGITHINDSAKIKADEANNQPVVQAAAPDAAIPVAGADTASTKS